MAKMSLWAIAQKFGKDGYRYMSTAQWVFIAILALLNVIAFFTMGIDKRKAIKQKYRISEKFLLFQALLLGGFGSYVGMTTFRHKTKHKKFTIFVPIFMILNVVAIYFIFTKLK